jgi:exonuclease III
MDVLASKSEIVSGANPSPVSLSTNIMPLKFGTWNVNGWHTITAPQINLLQKVDCDLLALQEVTEQSYTVLVESNLFSTADFSLRLRPAKEDEGKGRRLGCAILCKSNFSFISVQLLEKVPLPERTLITSIKHTNGEITICSFHAPPGVNWGEIKPQTFCAISNWLTQHKERLLFGMDANAPMVDHPNHEYNEWWWEDEALLLGSNPAHHLKDAFRTLLDANPGLSEKITTSHPNGPLAISYRRGRSTKTVPCRYDFIYTTPDFVVKNVSYLYDEAVEAGSDHALVVADLELITD